MQKKATKPNGDTHHLPIGVICFLENIEGGKHPLHLPKRYGSFSLYSKLFSVPVTLQECTVLIKIIGVRIVQLAHCGCDYLQILLWITSP